MLRAISLLLIAPHLYAAYASRDLVLPVVGRSTGADGRLFDTAIWITNVSPRAADVTLSFYKSAFSNRAPQKNVLHLAAGETRVFDSMTMDGTGAMRIEASADVAATARTWSRMPNEPESRTIGASFAAIPVQFAIGNGESTELQGVAPRSARYKLYLVETAGRALGVSVTLVDANGTALADKRLFLDAYQQTTADAGELFPNINADHALLRIAGVNGEGRVVAAGSLIASDSKDSSAFEMTFATKSRHRLSTGEAIAYSTIALAVAIVALRRTQHSALSTQHSA